MTDYHQPVLLKESVHGLDIKPDGIYVDTTFGGGGHSREILSHLTTGKLIAFDQDKDVLPNLPDDERFIFVQHNFRFLKNFLRYHGIESIDGLLADLGVSSHHFDTAQRGFSFRHDSAIDMRMNQDSGFSAVDLLNSYDLNHLTKVFREYGELSNARRVAHCIITYREKDAIDNTRDLIEALSSVLPRHAEHSFLAKVYQAIRIEVNHEMDYLRQMLEQTLQVLKPGGRLVVISYHSLEDRIVKTFIKNGAFEEDTSFDLYGNKKSVFKSITRKVIIPSEEEIKRNNRARSAKLRIAEKN
ncbi:MAG: 16S rRNA (cytosine(1402)-N(4))-methyltransferase RsmH [Bacteroidales bacterium]|nr:16S rRNA (cytosine(1402)-N(4))-methyltransferase RsmH [Bacteroidales bacterium]MBN2817967.1 16S rRNA (cytosine(1402)-N(4))-methyltransferase RsmH [Bacteroidales bacterium]